MQPQAIYSNNPSGHHKASPRKAIVVIAGLLFGVVLIAGASFGFSMLRLSQPNTNDTAGGNAVLVDGSTAMQDEKGTTAPHNPSPTTQGTSSESSTSSSKASPVSPSNPSKPGKPGGGTSSGGGSPSPAPSYTPPSAPPQPTADACGAYIYRSNGTRWNCTFVDDFNGSQLNLSKWSVATSPNDFFQLFECYYDRPENVYVSGGYLNLVSRRENPQLGCGWRGGVGYSGGMVRTYKKHNINRGKVEIRIKAPRSNGQYGIGTSLWMIPVPSGRPGAGDAGWYGAWPASGEIDIAEIYGPFDDFVNPSLHYNVKNGHRLQYSCGQENYNAETVTARCNVPGATTGFHTYSVEWENDTITMVYDGKKVLVDKWNSTQGGTAPFDKDFYLNITQGFANIPIPGPYNAVLPATSQIDYVKIWQ